MNEPHFGSHYLMHASNVYRQLLHNGLGLPCRWLNVIN